MVILGGSDKIVTYPIGENTVNIIKYTSNLVDLEVNTTEPCFLVMSDTYYPGWNVYVNNNKGEILDADYAFRAVELKSGYNYIEFRYEPCFILPRRCNIDSILNYYFSCVLWPRKEKIVKNDYVIVSSNIFPKVFFTISGLHSVIM